jgi:hypothetical protein
MMGRATGNGKTGMPMLYCPNYDCPFRVSHGRAAEYSDAERCSDCGAGLKSGSALTVKEAEDADLGPPLAEPILLPPSPLASLYPSLIIALGVMVAGVFIGYLGGAIIAPGLAMLRHQRRVAPRILPHERGFIVVVGDERIVYPSSRLTQAQVSSRELRVAGLKLGYLHDLTLITGTQRRLFTGFSRGETAPFLDFARALSARSSLR